MPTATVFGRALVTAGVTTDQLDRAIALGEELDRLTGASAAKDLLREQFGLTSRKELTAEKAEEYLAALAERLTAARAAARLAAKAIGPYRITRSDERRGHKYDVYDRNGKELAHALPGITTPLNVLDKPALLPWIARLTGEAFKAKLRAVLLDEPIPDLGAAREALLPLLNVDGYKLANETKQRAGKRGTDSHAVAEIVGQRFRASEPIDDAALALMLVAQGELESADVWLCCLALRDWFLRLKPRILGTEKMVACLHCGCAATLDLHVILDGPKYEGEWVLDIKTSGGVYESHALQTSFQAHAMLQMKRGLHERHCAVNRRLRIGALWVNKDAEGGCEIVEFDNTQATLRAVQQVIDLYRWKRKPWRKRIASFPRTAGEVAETTRMMQEKRAAKGALV